MKKEPCYMFQRVFMQQLSKSQGMLVIENNMVCNPKATKQVAKVAHMLSDAILQKQHHKLNRKQRGGGNEEQIASLNEALRMSPFLSHLSFQERTSTNPIEAREVESQKATLNEKLSRLLKVASIVQDVVTILEKEGLVATSLGKYKFKVQVDDAWALEFIKATDDLIGKILEYGKEMDVYRTKTQSDATGAASADALKAFEATNKSQLTSATNEWVRDFNIKVDIEASVLPKPAV